MKRLIALTAALGLGASALYAGGPVVVEDTVVEEAAPSSSGWVLPVIIAVISIAILTSKDDSQGQTW